MVVKLVQNAYNMVIFLKNVFSPPYYEISLQKKTDNFERWKN